MLHRYSISILKTFSAPSESSESGFVDLHIALAKSSYSSYNSLAKSSYSLLRAILCMTLSYLNARHFERHSWIHDKNERAILYTTLPDFMIAKQYIVTHYYFTTRMSPVTGRMKTRLRQINSRHAKVDHPVNLILSKYFSIKYIYAKCYLSLF